MGRCGHRPLQGRRTAYLPPGGRCRALARRKRNAGGNLTISTPHQASSHIQYFAVPLPPQCAHWGTLPPGEGIGGRSMTARKPPLCKGRWHGASRDGGIVRCRAGQSPSQPVRLTAPFTQGGLFAAGPRPRPTILSIYPHLTFFRSGKDWTAHGKKLFTFSLPCAKMYFGEEWGFS